MLSCSSFKSYSDGELSGDISIASSAFHDKWIAHGKPRDERGRNIGRSDVFENVVALAASSVRGGYNGTACTSGFDEHLVVFAGAGAVGLVAEAT